MKNELISVIVPVYQVSQYLGKCIDSILGQSYGNIEVLLIDDASTDGGEEICDIYKKRDKRIRVFHSTENKGLSAARNRGIEEAKGKLLAFVDGDDWVHPDYLFYLYKALQDTNCKLSQCESELVFDGTSMEMCRIFDEHVYVYDYKAYFEFLSLILKRDCVTVWNKLYTADLFQHIRFPEGRIHEDEFVTYKLVCEAQKIAVLHSKLYYYRRRQSGIMGTFSQKRLDAHIAFGEREKYFRVRGEEKLLRLTEQVHYHWILDHISKFAEYGYEETVKKLCRDKEVLEKNMNADERKNAVYLFPFSKIPFGSRIIIYGAGNMGKQFFHQILKSSFCQLTGWVDRNAASLRQAGYPVKTIREFMQTKEAWDFMIIAVADMDAAFEIVSGLKSEFAVPDHKIIRYIEEIE